MMGHWSVKRGRGWSLVLRHRWLTVNISYLIRGVQPGCRWVVPLMIHRHWGSWILVHVTPMVRNRAILVVWLVGRWPMVHDTSLRWVRESGGAIGRIGRSVVVGMMVLLR